MKNRFFMTCLLSSLVWMSQAQSTSNEPVPFVGGSPMYPMKNIVENAVQSAQHTTLVAAVKAAGLVDVLAGDGPFTVFAPMNSAFEKLPKGTVSKLLEPSAKATLTKVLTHHVVAGRWRYDDLYTLAKKGGQQSYLTTVAGEKVWIQLEGERLIVVDTKKNKAQLLQTDVMQKNGVIHVTDTVLMPD
jgi:uncharacterized surface protein with fasciclin (FAS1) repeats